MGLAKALKRIGSVAERHTEDHEDVAESRIATTRRTGFWRTLGHQRAKRTSTGNLCGFANASGGRMLIGVGLIEQTDSNGIKSRTFEYDGSHAEE